MEGVSDIQQQQQQAEGVPVAQRSSWSSFLKSLRTCWLVSWKSSSTHITHTHSIASVSGDLSSLTAPPFILSPTSLTEFPGIFFFLFFGSSHSPPCSILVWASASLCGHRRCTRQRGPCSGRSPLVHCTFFFSLSPPMSSFPSQEHTQGPVYLSQRIHGLWEKVPSPSPSFLSYLITWTRPLNPVLGE